MSGAGQIGATAPFDGPSLWRAPAKTPKRVPLVVNTTALCVLRADRQRPWLLRQVEIDTAFLRRLNVLDYSLLLAQQPLQSDERSQGLSFASLIMRTKM